MKFVLEWDDTFSVYNPKIDEQHKFLFQIISSIPEEFSKDDAQRALLQLAFHARKHFKTEEQFMETMGYPDLEKHKRHHTTLINQLKEAAETNFPDRHSLIQFKQFIINWINNHFLDEDMDYARFSRKDSTR